MANIQWHSTQVDSVLSQLGTDPQQGLTVEEARRRLQEHGFNELRKETKASPFILFINQFKNTLIIILAVATILSAIIGDLLDAGIILAIIVFCALLGFVQEYRAERALDALKKMLTPTITALRGGREEEIPSKELVPGDIVLLEAGDKIPADGRLIEVHSLQCDEAPLTGESFPVEKDLKVLPESVPVGDRKNMVFTGTAVSYGRGKAVVTDTGFKTEFGKIATELGTVSQEKTPLEKRTEEIGKWLGIIAVSVCVLVVVTSIVREAIGGTLTKGEMTVRRVFGGGKSVEVSGVGYAPEGGLSPASNNPSLNMLFKGGILCNDSKLLEEGGKWSIKGDPTEGALVVLGAKAGLGRDEIREQSPRIGEIPFSSDRKRMTT